MQRNVSTLPPKRIDAFSDLDGMLLSYVLDEAPTEKPSYQPRGELVERNPRGWSFQSAADRHSRLRRSRAWYVPSDRPAGR